MPLAEFNVVLVGENFPISSIRVSDFVYRHRELKEILRVPVAVQAENELVAISVLPDRFQAAIKSADQLAVQCEGLQELVATFLDYAGKRTIKGVGHNARWTIPDSQRIRSRVASIFVNSDAVSAVIGATEPLADVSVVFEGPHGSKGLMTVPSIADSDVTLDFNFHFDVPQMGEPAQLAAWLQQSLETVSTLSLGFESRVEGIRV